MSTSDIERWAQEIRWHTGKIQLMSQTTDCGEQNAHSAYFDIIWFEECEHK